jgi:hypothetical protein
MDTTQWIEKNLAKDLSGTLKVELYGVSDIELVKSLRQFRFILLPECNFHSNGQNMTII